MKKPDYKKLLITGLLLLPLLFLGVYTYRGLESAKKPRKIVIPNLKLSTLSSDVDAVASLIRSGDYETALAQIDKNLKDPNIPDSQGVPLLLLASQQNKSDIASVLIAKGSDPDTADVNTGETPLIAAAKNGNLDMMNMLIVAGADLNNASKQGMTPLLSGIESGKRQVTEFLVSRGSLAGVSPQNLMKYASQKNFVGVEAMLKGGANPNYSDKNGNTALLAATANGDFDSVKVLLAYRANINAVNKLHMTPLLYALKRGNSEMAKYFLDRKADFNIADGAGKTPLYIAAATGNNALTQILLTMGSNYSAAADDKLTPQQAALKNGFTKTAKLIGDFIAYKNIPRDEQGRPVIQPKTQQQSAQPLQNTTGKINNNQGKQSSPKPKKAPVKTVINKLKTSTL